MYQSDFHLHSHLSPDAKPLFSEIAYAAIQKGLSEIAITDHYDLSGIYPHTTWDFKTTEYFAEYKRTKHLYEGKINIRSGIEIGQPHVQESYAREFIKSYPFDFVLGSVHNLAVDRDVHKLKETIMQPKILMQEYFHEVEKTIRWGEFDVLGHITYPDRYIFTETGVKYDFLELKDMLSHLLKLLIQSGKGMEVNTSGLRRDVMRLSADESIIKLYRDLGGEIITIGSDGHTKEEVGAGFREAICALKEAGFSYYSTFCERQASFHKIT